MCIFRKGEKWWSMSRMRLRFFVLFSLYLYLYDWKRKIFFSPPGSKGGSELEPQLLNCNWWLSFLVLKNPWRSNWDSRGKPKKKLMSMRGQQSRRSISGFDTVEMCILVWGWKRPQLTSTPNFHQSKHQRKRGLIPWLAWKRGSLSPLRTNSQHLLLSRCNKSDRWNSDVTSGAKGLFHLQDPDRCSQQWDWYSYPAVEGGAPYWS